MVRTRKSHISLNCQTRGAYYNWTTCRCSRETFRYIVFSQIIAKLVLNGNVLCSMKLAYSHRITLAPIVGFLFCVVLGESLSDTLGKCFLSIFFFFDNDSKDFLLI